MLDPVVGISVEIPKLAARLTSQLAAKRLAAGLLNNWHNCNSRAARTLHREKSGRMWQVAPVHLSHQLSAELNAQD